MKMTTLGCALAMVASAACLSACDFAKAVAEGGILAALLEPCLEDSDCAPPLFCHSENKVCALGTAFEPCTQDWDCAFPLFCHSEDQRCVISEDPCIGVTYTGLCDGEIVTWCDDEELHGIDCSENEQVCGFDAENGVYNCLDPE